MSATYAHIMLVDTLCEQADTISNVPPTIRMALQNYSCFCKLGAVSPDCPSVVFSTGATGYGNIMHYLRPADFIRYAIPKVFSMNFSLADARACISWIFGYAAHLVTDMTIHPVVCRKVGGYSTSSQAKLQHRLCEFHQDVYIYSKVYGSEIVGSDFLKFSGFADCSINGNLNKLNPAIADLWAYCLNQYPRAETKSYVRLPSRSLKPENWYATFGLLFQDVVTKGVAKLQRRGFNYPYISALDSTFIEGLPTASGGSISYDQLYQRASRNIRACWENLAVALHSNRPELFALPNASLDTGLAEATGELVFIV